MNRRGFLKALAGSVAALSAGGIALLEEELWTPTKTIVLPPADGWISRGNTLITCSQIAKEALKILHRELLFNPTQAELAGAMATLNQTLMVRKPPRYVMAIENTDWYGNRVRA